MKLKFNTFIFISILFVCFSCKKENQNFLESSLKFAGENRAELEKVLEHYSQKTEDSLKYKAACFLIENMPNYYSLSGKDIDSIKTSIKTFGIRNDYPVTSVHVRIVAAEKFADKYTLPVNAHSEKVYDSHVITAEYLIENIEIAFQVWTEKPWGKFMSFDRFCEEILPYRIGNEPLENWRKAYYEKFQPILDSLLGKEDPVEVAKTLYDTIYNQRWIFDNEVLNEYVGALSLLTCRVGDCRLLAHYATYAFRAVGIPSGIDCILQNPDMMYRHHYWNYMKDQFGNSIPLELYQNTLFQEPENKRKKGKVYRICFGKQPSSIPENYKTEKIPPVLNDGYIVDVSDSYFDKAPISIKIDKKIQKGNLLYLGVFNNKTWIPITCSKIIKGEAIFNHLESHIVYYPLCYQNEKLTLQSLPFIILENGQSRFLKPKMENLQEMELSRKYPVPHWIEEYKHRSVGGLFQGANKADFSDAITLYTTTTELDMYYHSVSIENTQKFKYLRYFSAPDGHCNMAEIRFLSSGKELAGNVIGTEGSSNNQKNWSKYAVFDKDPVTYFDSTAPHKTWVGLALEDAATVTEIEYLYRNDDNNIREGDIYELLYFSDRGVISLGERTGDKSGVLIYESVPSNALYWLRDKTRGQEERVFTYEDGKQVFW
ncbi:hypothetical protein FACS189426_19560 [Bacteroidia bacterium]|nr:hypothetical protein FACS189426_19560 [Bacteroidia bacterium]